MAWPLVVAWQSVTHILLATVLVHLGLATIHCLVLLTSPTFYQECACPSYTGGLLVAGWVLPLLLVVPGAVTYTREDYTDRRLLPLSTALAMDVPTFYGPAIMMALVYSIVTYIIQHKSRVTTQLQHEGLENAVNGKSVVQGSNRSSVSSDHSSMVTYHSETSTPSMGSDSGSVHSIPSIDLDDPTVAISLPNGRNGFVHLNQAPPNGFLVPNGGLPGPSNGNQLMPNGMAVNGNVMNGHAMNGHVMNGSALNGHAEVENTNDDNNEKDTINGDQSRKLKPNGSAVNLPDTISPAGSLDDKKPSPSHFKKQVSSESDQIQLEVHKADTDSAEFSMVQNDAAKSEQEENVGDVSQMQYSSNEGSSTPSEEGDIFSDIKEGIMKEPVAKKLSAISEKDDSILGEDSRVKGSTSEPNEDYPSIGRLYRAKATHSMTVDTVMDDFEISSTTPSVTSNTFSTTPSEIEHADKAFMADDEDETNINVKEPLLSDEVEKNDINVENIDEQQDHKAVQDHENKVNGNKEEHRDVKAEQHGNEHVSEDNTKHHNDIDGIVNRVDNQVGKTISSDEPECDMSANNEESCDNSAKHKCGKEELNSPLDEQDIRLNVATDEPLVPDENTDDSTNKTGVENPGFVLNDGEEMPLSDSIRVKQKEAEKERTQTQEGKEPIEQEKSSSELSDPREHLDEDGRSLGGHSRNSSAGGGPFSGPRRSILRRDKSKRESQKTVKFDIPDTEEHKESKKIVRKPTGRVPRNQRTGNKKGSKQGSGKKNDATSKRRKTLVKQKAQSKDDSELEPPKRVISTRAPYATRPPLISTSSFEYMSAVQKSQAERLACRIKAQQKNVNVIFIVFIAFVILSAPSLTLDLVVNQCPGCNITRELQQGLLWLMYSASLVLPIILLVLFQDYSNAISESKSESPT